MRMIRILQSCLLVLVTSEGNGMNSMKKAVLCQTKGLPVLVVCLTVTVFGYMGGAVRMQ